MAIRTLYATLRACAGTTSDRLRAAGADSGGIFGAQPGSAAANHDSRARQSAQSSLLTGQDRLQFCSHAGHRPAGSGLRAGNADVAQLVEHHLAKVRVAGSNPVVRSETPNAVGDQPDGSRVPSRAFSSVASTAVRRKTPLAEWPSGLGKGLQSPLHGFDSRLRLVSPGRLAQRESASLTRKRSLVQSQYRPPHFFQSRSRRGSQSAIRPRAPLAW
jgi:hypothetical protein